MSGDKSIRFSFVVDETSANRVKQVFRELMTEAQKYAQTLKDLNLGTIGTQPPGQGGPSPARTPAGGAGGGPIALKASAQVGQIFNDNKNIFKGLADSSKDALRVMTDALKTEIDKQKREISSFDSAISSLTKSYKGLQEAARVAASVGVSPADLKGTLAGIEQYQTSIASLASQRQQAQERLGGLSEHLEIAREEKRKLAIRSDPYSVLGGPEEEPGESRWGRFKNFLAPRLAQGARPRMVAGMMFAGASAGVQEIQDQQTELITHQARQANAFKTLEASTKQGSLRHAFAMMNVLGDPEHRRNFLDIAQSRNLTRASEGGGAFFNALTQFNPAAPLKAMRAMSGVNIDTVIKEKLRDYMEKGIASDPNFYQNLDIFEGRAGGNVSVMRAMGVGERGRHAYAKMGASMGMDIGQLAGIYGSMSGLAGRRGAHELMGMGATASVSGMSPAALAALAAGGQAQNIFGTFMGNQFLDATTANRAAEIVGRSVQQSGISGVGLAGALTNVGLSSDPARQVWQMGQRGAALGSLGQAFGGPDGLGQGINILSAISTLGQGSSLDSQNVLAELGSDPARLMDALRGEDRSGMLLARGITTGHVQDFFKDSFSRSLSARFVDTGATDPASAFNRKLVTQYGGDISAMRAAEIDTIADPNRRNSALQDMLTQGGVALRSSMPQTFRDDSQAKEAFAMLLGMDPSDTLLETGKRPRGGRDAAYGSTEFDYEKGKLQSQEKEYFDFLSKNAEQLKTMGADLQKIGDVFKNMGETSTSAGDAAKALNQLRDAVIEVTAAMKGKSVEEIRSVLDKKMTAAPPAEKRKAASGSVGWRQQLANSKAGRHPLDSGN